MLTDHPRGMGLQAILFILHATVKDRKARLNAMVHYHQGTPCRGQYGAQLMFSPVVRWHGALKREGWRRYF